MKKGFVKVMMLYIISRGEITGYGLIKEIEGITGSKPSTGTIYPLLKSMAADGWISGESRDGKTYYQIMKGGKEKLNEIRAIKGEFMKKIFASLSIANEMFDYEKEEDMSAMGIVGPLIGDVMRLRRSGVEAESIQAVISKARENLRELDKAGKANRR